MIGHYDTADLWLDAASKYIGKELSAASGSAAQFHEHNQDNLDRVNEALGGARSSSKVASFFRLLNSKKD